MRLFGSPIANNPSPVRKNNAPGLTNSNQARPVSFGMDNLTPAPQSTSQDIMAVLGPRLAARQRIAAEKIYNQQQSEVVSAATLNLAQAMGLPPERMGVLLVASEFYNKGKDPVAQSFWVKQGPLTAEEQQAMQNYPLASANRMIAASVEKRAQGQSGMADELARAVPIVLAHKFQFDGKGYPGQTIAGNQIPIEAQILGVVDAYYAMISQRPYRPAMAPEAALQTLQAEAGTKWNPAVVEAFVRKTQ